MKESTKQILYGAAFGAVFTFFVLSLGALHQFGDELESHSELTEFCQKNDGRNPKVIDHSVEKNPRSNGVWVTCENKILYLNVTDSANLSPR